MIIKARHSPFFVRFFSFYSRNRLRHYFHHVELDCHVNTTGRPVLLIGNRFSWWDGFIAYRLNDLYFGKKFHIMMPEEQLASRPFLKRAGAFSIKRGSRTVVESIRYASTQLYDNRNLVVLYPQGMNASIHRKPVRFERGAERIIAGASDKLMILFYVALPDWYSGKRPGLTVRVIEYSAMERNIADLEESYNIFMNECVARQIPD